MNKIEKIKELLHIGQRSAISTKDFESMIEQLETSQACVKALEEENEALKAQCDTYINLMNIYKNIIKR